MNTIESMCEAPPVMGKHSTTTIANPSHPSSPPSLGFNGSLGSAPPEGGVSKYPGGPMDPKLGGLLVGKGWQPHSLCPSNLNSWRCGCGVNLPPTNLPTTPKPYRPTPPTPTTFPIPLHCPIPAIVTSTNPNQVRTATGGKIVLPKVPIKKLSAVCAYVCEGVDCSYQTNSPYKFFNHISTPHLWKPGSQNWCISRAKARAQGNAPLGIKVSGPTQFASMDIRVKQGMLPMNIVSSGQDCVQSPPSIPTSSTSNPTTSAIKVTTQIKNPTSYKQTSSPPTITPSPSTIATTPSLPTCTHWKDVSTPFMSNPTTHSICDVTWGTSIHVVTISSPIKDTVAYFPISYFLWKKNLPSVAPTPTYPPWSQFPCPKAKKVTSTSHLKGNRRLPNNKVYCWGVNDPQIHYSSQVVTPKIGVGKPKFQESGTWARYSQLLVPKKYYQDKTTTHNFYLTNHKLAPKKKLQRPKGGKNTVHKSHGISLHDRLNGIGKTIPSEIPCRKHPASKAFKTLLHNAIRNTTTNNDIGRLINSTTNATITTTSHPPYVKYPSTRTKWTRPLGGSLKGGGSQTNITITLIGNKPYDQEDDSRMLTVTCLDSVTECSLALIQHHSDMIQNMIQECDCCNSVLPCLLKPAIILPDYTTYTVSSLLILLRTGTTTVIDQRERLNVQELQRLLGCGFSKANLVYNFPYTPRIKEKWEIRNNGAKERTNSSGTTKSIPTVHAPDGSNVILGYREPK